jgi:hypothetical protein
VDNERQHNQLGECSSPRWAMDEQRSGRGWPTFVYSYMLWRTWGTRPVPIGFG